MAVGKVATFTLKAHDGATIKEYEHKKNPTEHRLPLDLVWNPGNPHAYVTIDIETYNESVFGLLESNSVQCINLIGGANEGGISIGLSYGTGDSGLWCWSNFKGRLHVKSRHMHLKIGNANVRFSPKQLVLSKLSTLISGETEVVAYRIDEEYLQVTISDKYASNHADIHVWRIKSDQ